MLAPDDLTPAEDALKTFYAEVRAADQLATVGGSLRFSAGFQDEPWVVMLDSRVRRLQTDAADWYAKKPVVTPLVLGSFSRYRNAFAAVSQALAAHVSPSEAVFLLDRLWVQATACEADVQKAREGFQDWASLVLSNLDGVNDSLQDAWRELGASEQRVVALSQQITAVQMEIGQLEGVVSLDSLSSKAVSNLVSVFSNVVSMVYKVTISGLSMPYLTAVQAFFTLGKLFVTIFANASAVHKKLAELERYGLDLRAAQRGLAQAKAAIASLYELKSLLRKQQASLASLEGFWQSEARNLHTVRDRFALMPVIPPDDPELTQLPIARAVWGTLEGEARGLLNGLTQGVHGGTEIVIAT